MAGQEFPLSIDRRRLLTSAAALTAASIGPCMESAEPAIHDFVQSSALSPKVQASNVSAATARRLLEIAQRNAIRREANLPLLSIAKELRRMKQQEKLEEFTRFETAYGKAVWEKVLKARREAEGDPNWRPSWMEGMSLQNQVREIVWE